ncbi:MAG: hypothetical protein A4S09_14275 [Proteobacteria bacterium SG_bin7]|nr:MAG: hypothetical protein A4S09_14275 [Proteobacteria bacterium SG_bin7]
MKFFNEFIYSTLLKRRTVVGETLELGVHIKSDLKVELELELKSEEKFDLYEEHPWPKEIKIVVKARLNTITNRFELLMIRSPFFNLIAYEF